VEQKNWLQKYYSGFNLNLCFLSFGEENLLNNSHTKGNFIPKRFEEFKLIHGQPIDGQNIEKQNYLHQTLEL